MSIVSKEKANKNNKSMKANKNLPLSIVKKNNVHRPLAITKSIVPRPLAIKKNNNSNLKAQDLVKFINTANGRSILIDLSKLSDKMGVVLKRKQPNSVIALSLATTAKPSIIKKQSSK